MEPEYSNREIDRMFTHISGELGDIKKEVRYTNGKVRKIIVALVALAFFCMGLGLKEVSPIFALFL